MALTKPVINSGKGILGNFNAKGMLLLNVNYMRPNSKNNTPDVCTVV